MSRRFIFYLLSLSVSFVAFSQSVDKKISDAMNASDWFALDSIYSSTPKDSINPFLEIYSRCLIGNRLNRTDVSIPTFQELLNSSQLDLGNLIPAVHMFGMDLSREGHNAEAAAMINSILPQISLYLDSVTAGELTASANRYAAMAKYQPYGIEFTDNEEGIIPFKIVPVGPVDKESVHMHLTGSTINGQDADITFDTGAGVNIMTPEMAKKYNLIPLEGTTITVAGFGKSEGYFAIAREIKIGNITIKDLPFAVAPFSSHNEEADVYFENFNIIVGSELMLQLRDLTIDFSSNQILISKETPRRTSSRSNICFSSGMNLLTKGSINGEPAVMCLDSGDAAFGSINSTYYMNHQEYVTSHGKPDTIRAAGVGGVTNLQCYKVPDMEITIGGNTVTPEAIVVKTEHDKTMDYEARIGLRTMMLYNKLRFNMTNFVLTTEN